MSEPPYFLELEKFATSKKEAERLAIEFLSFNMPSPKGGWAKATYNFGNPQKTVSFNRIVEEIRSYGVSEIQINQDGLDDIYGGTFGMTIPNNLGIMTFEYAGFKQSFKTPATHNPVEWELADDILAYREEACLWSNDYNFKECTRNYRAYLISCVAFVDAFINRHVLLYNYRKIQSKHLIALQSCTRLEERLELFLKVSSNKGLTAINQGVEWIHFKKLRQLRNAITHINTPTIGYSIPDFAEHLNLVKMGVGGLLKKIRSIQGKPSLSCIEKLRNCPNVFYNDIRFRDGGSHVVKRVK